MNEVFEVGEEEIFKVAEKVINLLHKRNVVLLQGDLGAGKTTLVKEVCNKLGIKSITNSPSFGLINEYGDETNKVFHIDLYRLNSIEEFWSIGGIDYIDGDFPCFIEWPDLIRDYVAHEKTLEINIKHTPNNTREYSMNYFQ